MPKKQFDVDGWLGRETPRIRRALESASRYFDKNDHLTVNTLEAVYARQSSFRHLDGEARFCRRRWPFPIRAENRQRIPPNRVLKNPRGGSLLKKVADARRAQATAEAYVTYTPHKGAQRTTKQMPLFQQTANRLKGQRSAL